MEPNSLIFLLSSPWQSLNLTWKYLNNIGSDGPPILRSILDKTLCILPEISCKQFCNTWFAMSACCEGAGKSRVSCDLLGCQWAPLPCWMNSSHLPTAGLPVCRMDFPQSQVIHSSQRGSAKSWLGKLLLGLRSLSTGLFTKEWSAVGVGASLTWKQFPICSLDVTCGWGLDWLFSCKVSSVIICPSFQIWACVTQFCSRCQSKCRQHPGRATERNRGPLWPAASFYPCCMLPLIIATLNHGIL